MTTQVSTVITFPAEVRRGELFEIRTLIRHPMETGYRRNADGEMMPRNLIRAFRCSFIAPTAAPALVFESTLFAAVAANPFLAFHMRASESGELVFEWRGDNGFAHTERLRLTVK